MNEEDGTTAGRWALVSPADTDTVTSIRPPDCPSAIPVSRGPHDQGLTTLPPPGQSGHGGTATLRRRSARIVQGRVERGYTDAFELICCECGDHPYLDYSEIPPRLQQIRGPYTMRAGLARMPCSCEQGRGSVPSGGGTRILGVPWPIG